MKRSLFENGGHEVQVGFLDTDAAEYLDGTIETTTTAAFAADTVVLVTPTAGGVWIAINDNPTADVADGSHYIEFAQDFAVESGDKINSTGAICITPYK